MVALSGVGELRAHGRGVVKELSTTAKKVRDPALEFWVADLVQGHAKALRGELEPGEGDFGPARALADDLGQPSLRWFALWHSACEALLRGDLAAAERFAEEGLQAGGGAGQPDALMVYGTPLLPIRVHQGRAEEIVERFEHSVERQSRKPASGRARRGGFWAVGRAGSAFSYCWAGRTEEGAAIVEEAARDRFDHVHWDQMRLTVLALYADAASLGGVTDAAAALYELLEPWADEVVWNGASSYGYVSTYLGLLAATVGWDERADEHFALACDLQERKGMLLWAARARLGWAEALAGRGETARAKEEAASALALAREHGYRAIELRAATIAR
jgi:hypothetical protein